MASVASFADIDIAARKLERRIDAHVGRFLDRLVDGEERSDFDEAADARDQDNSEDEPDRLAFQSIMKSEECHAVTPRAAVRGQDDRAAYRSPFEQRHGSSSRYCSILPKRRSETSARR